MTQELYDDYVGILREELVAALGCTEPISIAYAAAKAREVLGEFPERMVAACSGNIIKNAKGVIVPATKDLRGVDAAAIIGVVGGDAAKQLEVLEDITEEQLAQAKELLGGGFCEVRHLPGAEKLHIVVQLYSGRHSTLVEIMQTHTGIVRIEKDGAVLPESRPTEDADESGGIGRGCLRIGDILEFADALHTEDVKDLMERQIAYNTAIAREGLQRPYGSCVGKTLLDVYGTDVRVRARAMAAAGSDARMSGCEMPVITNSGSGNQGMTVSLPIIEYAKELDAPPEKLYRALCVGNLVAIRIKAQIGKLSAFCGAVSAGAGAGAGIAWMHGYSKTIVEQTIVNALANVSGIVCDGAKPSCAAKIASCVDAAILGMYMAADNLGFRPGEGIVKSDVEETIDSVAQIANKGMQSTDDEILRIMVDV